VGVDRHWEHQDELKACPAKLAAAEARILELEAELKRRGTATAFGDGSDGQATFDGTNAISGLTGDVVGPLETARGPAWEAARSIAEVELRRWYDTDKVTIDDASSAIATRISRLFTTVQTPVARVASADQIRSVVAQAVADVIAVNAASTTTVTEIHVAGVVLGKAVAERAVAQLAAVPVLSAEDLALIERWRRDIRPLVHPSLEFEHEHNARARLLDRLRLAARGARPARPAAARYFVLDDNGAYYFVVASDLDHARRILGASGAVFGDHGERGPGPLAEAEAAGLVTWREIDASEASRKRCHTDDGRGTIPLTECRLGDNFCSEY